MVKIGKYILFEKAKASFESYKASISAGGAKPGRKVFHLGEHTWTSRCKHFDTLANLYPLFNQSCLALAGMVTAQGVFNRPAVNKQDETYALAEEALWRCDQLNRRLRVNSRMYDTVYRATKYGSCFWEVSRTPEFGFRLCPSQEYIEPAEVNATGDIVKWRQSILMRHPTEWPDAAFKGNDADSWLVHVGWNVTPQTWPFGSSLGMGLETELEALVGVEGSAKDYMDKAAWPYELLALGNENSSVLDSDYQSAKTEWKNRKPGEGFTTRNMPVQILPGGTNSAPIRELAALCQLMKDNIHDGFTVPPISKLYNSTEASAKVLTAEVMTRLGQPIQWILKEAYEEHVLKPFLEGAGFSRKSCPEATFESPDVHKKEEGEYWVGLVTAKIQSPQQAAEHLGLEYDEQFWKEEQKREDEQLQQKAQGKEEKPSDGGERNVEEWKVTRVHQNRPNR